MESSLTQTETMVIIKAKLPRKVQWSAEVQDNEHAGKKKSKGIQ